MDTNRRNMIRLCGSVLTAMSVSPECLAIPAHQTHPVKRYHSVLLTDPYNKPLHCDELKKETEYVFHYPYRSTPCFLIDLGKTVEGGVDLHTEKGEHYTWKGGAGPKKSIVAFSAICAHRMSHPSPTVSFIGYRKNPVGYLTKKMQVEQRASVIQCCSEQSVYDPGQGARVLGGPAPQPLAAIELNYQEDGKLYATGVYGGAMFDKFFKQFGHRLLIEYQTLDYEAIIDKQTVVEPLEQFTKRKIECS